MTYSAFDVHLVLAQETTDSLARATTSFPKINAVDFGDGLTANGFVSVSSVIGLISSIHGR